MRAPCSLGVVGKGECRSQQQDRQQEGSLLHATLRQLRITGSAASSVHIGSAAAMPTSGEPHRCGPGSATTGMSGGTRLGALKLSACAKLFAAWSRTFNGLSPQRHSTNLRIELWSYK